MTPPDAAPPATGEPTAPTGLSRRELRAQSGAVLVTEPDQPAPTLAMELPAAQAPHSAQPPHTPTALTALTAPTAPTTKPGKAARTSRVALNWLDGSALALTAPADLEAAATPFVPVGPDLLGRPPRRSPFRAGVLVPIAIIALLVITYAGTTIMWPLNAVEPTIAAVQVDSAPSAVAAVTWPTQGSGAVSVAGVDGVVASTPDAHEIASITKIVTALLVLEEKPLALGEQGPEYRFTWNDRSRYWGYRNRGESALDVPVGGTLTEYQMLEGMLIGSANNYADRLANDIWPTDAVYASAANAWLQAHGVPGITIVEPTGFDSRNAASPGALIPLAQKALANPVIAEIVAKTTTDLPGAGHVENTNGLLADAGVIGVKTGSLDGFNLLAAKNITVGETPIRLYAAVLGQADDKSRVDATRALFAQVEAELQPEPSVVAGTTVGIVETAWGERVDIRTDADADVVLWNGDAGTVATTFDLGASRGSGDDVGDLTVSGPLNTTTVDVELTGDIEPPTIWWRLLHPLTLFGLDG